MQALQSYVTYNNSVRALYGEKPVDIDTSEGRNIVAQMLECSLSPEVLTWDGELDWPTVQANRKKLMQAVAELKALDPSVKFYEV